jgi:hypothetical protein
LELSFHAAAQRKHMWAITWTGQCCNKTKALQNIVLIK